MIRGRANPERSLLAERTAQIHAGTSSISATEEARPALSGRRAGGGEAAEGLALEVTFRSWLAETVVVDTGPGATTAVSELANHLATLVTLGRTDDRDLQHRLTQGTARVHSRSPNIRSTELVPRTLGG